MTYKKRILFIGEASCLATGFSNYYAELIPRLVATGKYEIGEIASYIAPGDPRMIEFVNNRWKWWGVMPTTQQEAAIFNQPSQHPHDRGQLINQFGANILEKVLAEFKPDCVIDIRDWWMIAFEQRSVFRDWFKWLICPTVDSIPQEELWMQYYGQADLVMAYSDFGIHALKQQNPLLKVFPEPMRPPLDTETFKPLDKTEIRKKYLLRPDLPVIGVVQRNQSRKLHLDTIDAFALMKNKYANKYKQVHEAVLLIHSSWPDNAFSYDYPRHIMRLHSYPWMQYHRKGIKDDILQSLMCMNSDCKQYSVGHAMMLWNKPIQNGRILQLCKHCNQMSAVCPTSGANTYTRAALAEIYNLMDVCVQTSIAEGCGMPVNEAKACGVPVIVTDYSALSEKGRFPAEYIHIKERKIKEEDYTVNKGGLVNVVERFRHEPETGCFRALPDIEDLAEKMKNLLVNSDLRNKMGKEGRECALKHYNADVLAKRWEFILDNVKVKDRTQTWDSAIVINPPCFPDMIPDGLDDDAFFKFLYLEILKYNAVDPDGVVYWKQQLAQGATRQQLFEQFKGIAKNGADAENVRQQLRAQAAGMNIVKNDEEAWI